MLIATALAVALTVNVSAAPDIRPELVSRVLAETDTIWRNFGVTFSWQRAPRAVASAALNVVIGHNVHPVRAGGFALGWIMFEDSTPAPDIYVSYAHAYQLLVESSPVVGRLENMPRFERETLLARAMGRALAHEIGHYLLGSKEHTATGMLKAHRTALEFFGPDDRYFSLDAEQQSAITVRLRQELLIVSQ